uniref:Uncharacterized protein n=1 Tax=Avena sativa TaxID=4498 RepID=A0ACD5ZMB2_AVESA
MEIAGRQDRISKQLGDAALGCILYYLPAKEAARAAVLSSRWRHAFCGVHAISLEEPEDPISPDYDDEDTRSGSPCSHCDHDGTPRFASTVTAALLARNRRPDAPPPPLRALRVALYCYSREDASAVDHWVSYALSHAASPPAGLDLVLRLDREPLCSRPYGLHVRRSKVAHHGRFDGPSPHMEYTQRSIIDIFRCTVEEVQPSRKRHRPSASSSSPDESDSEEDARPRRMPRRRTSSSESSSLDDSDSSSDSSDSSVDDTLHSLEYRGAVPEMSLVTIHGGVSGLVSCKVDICGEEVSTADELAKLRDLLQQLASTKHLHLQSPRLGAGVDHEALARFPAYPCLLHLELTGRLPHGDDGVAAESPQGSGYPNPLCKKAELLDAHQLRYNEHEVLAAPAVTIPCLTNRVREINLVHYHGGRAQRTLAKFLLCNAPVLEKLYCGFARGPLWVQTKLKDEMQGWAMNKPEHNIFA